MADGMDFHLEFGTADGKWGTGFLKLVNYRFGVEDCSIGTKKRIFAVENWAYGVGNRVDGAGDCPHDVRN